MLHRHRNACAFELFLLWTVTILSPVVGTGSMIDAQCRMMCLNSHFSSSMLHTNGILEECLRHSNCSSCIYPCRTHFKSLELCEEKCQQASSAPALCLNSCTYVKSIKNENIGSCPSIESLGGFDKTCLETCSHDGDCLRRGQKCCDNGCGRTCQEPIVRRRNYPPKVHRLRVTENADGASVTVRWHVTRPPDPGEGVLYAVQMRNTTTSRRAGTHWIDVGVFDRRDTTVYLKPGRNYQFRVAAVNQNGSLGYCRPSSEFHLSTAPQKPGIPENVESGSWFMTDDKINMYLHWDPPRHSDVPISKYRIFYSKRPTDILPSLILIEVLTLDVKGTETSCILPNLEPDMKYFVQVMAIARYLDRRLSSNRSTNYIYTPSTQRDTEDRVAITSNPTQVMPGQPRNLHNDEPYWEDGSVKVKLKWKKPKGYKKTINRFTIHWEATVCSSDNGDEHSATEDYGSNTNDIYTPYRQKGASAYETSFVLYDLSFGCTYEVWVKPVFNDVWGPASSIQVMTPPCDEIAVKGGKPVCPTPVPDIPSAPQNMTKTYSIGASEISVRFNWAPPARSLYPLTGYRIYWARVKLSEGHSTVVPTIERDPFTVVVLSQRDLSYTIHNLTAGARYVVKLQALSSIGGGAIVAVDIKTPNMTLNPQIPKPTRPINTPAPDRSSQAIATQDNMTQDNAAGRLVASTLVMSLLILTHYVLMR